MYLLFFKVFYKNHPFVHCICQIKGELLAQEKHESAEGKPASAGADAAGVHLVLLVTVLTLLSVAQPLSRANWTAEPTVYAAKDVGHSFQLLLILFTCHVFQLLLILLYHGINYYITY